MNIDLKLGGHSKDLGDGFVVRRFLPSAQRQSVGPFIFFDHFGPVKVEPSSRHDVRPHPHIGLATVTYLFEGAMMHRDSLGVAQRIEPGAINWMTAGRGIVHSERRPEDLADQVFVNHGLQLWAALPAAHEEAEPAFSHTPAADIPVVDLPGVKLRVLIGEAFGAASPVPTFSKTIYLDIELQAGAVLDLPLLAGEMALYAIDGALEVDAEPLPAQTLGVLSGAARLTAASAVRVMLIGGDALEGKRFIWWNFVSSRKMRINEAADAWVADAMGHVPGETERIELPRRPVASGEDAPL